MTARTWCFSKWLFGDYWCSGLFSSAHCQFHSTRASQRLWHWLYLLIYMCVCVCVLCARINKILRYCFPFCINRGGALAVVGVGDRNRNDKLQSLICLRAPTYLSTLLQSRLAMWMQSGRTCGRNWWNILHRVQYWALPALIEQGLQYCNLLFSYILTTILYSTLTTG